MRTVRAIHDGRNNKKKMTSIYRFDNISTKEMKKDIADTQKEIDDMSDEKSVLMRNQRENRVSIYMLEGRIRSRQTFISELSKELEQRKVTNAKKS